MGSGLSSPPGVLSVRAEWDPEARVWVATSDDVPGLVTEAASIGLLVEKLEVMVPELLELNDGDDLDLPVELITRLPHRDRCAA